MRRIEDLALIHSLELANMVSDENRRQVQKWGVQNVTPAEWLLFLGEEFGELCEAVSEKEYRNGTDAEVVKEAIQVATLALKIAEMYSHNSHQNDPTAPCPGCGETIIVPLCPSCKVRAESGTIPNDSSLQ